MNAVQVGALARTIRAMIDSGASDEEIAEEGERYAASKADLVAVEARWTALSVATSTGSRVRRPGLRVGFEKANREVKPVCLEHTRRFEDAGTSRTRDGWAVHMIADLLRDKRVCGKALCGLPHAEGGACEHDAVAYWQAEIDTVCEAVERDFPDTASEILPTMRSASDHYSFYRWGMYVGVEPDGYIHS